MIFVIPNVRKHKKIPNSSSFLSCHSLFIKLICFPDHLNFVRLCLAKITRTVATHKLVNEVVMLHEALYDTVYDSSRSNQ